MTHDIAVNFCNEANLDIISTGYRYLARSLVVFYILVDFDWSRRKLGHLK